ncbi:unnamed protein product, partial [Laminaria digitata]
MMIPYGTAPTMTSIIEVDMLLCWLYHLYGARHGIYTVSHPRVFGHPRLLYKAHTMRSSSVTERRRVWSTEKVPGHGRPIRKILNLYVCAYVCATRRCPLSPPLRYILHRLECGKPQTLQI